MDTASMNHWQEIYRDKAPAQTSWFRDHLDTALQLIDGLRLAADAPVIDVGGGRATLVDDLLARGFSDVSVLDIAESAITQAHQRLGEDAARVRWLIADIAEAQLPKAHYALWHDRAVFHFFIDAAARRRYVANAAQAVRPGGYAVIAAFAPDGPERCSGLPVQRYDAQALAGEFAPAFAFISSVREAHATPWGAMQPFTHVVLRRQAG